MDLTCVEIMLEDLWRRSLTVTCVPIPVSETEPVLAVSETVLLASLQVLR